MNDRDAVTLAIGGAAVRFVFHRQPVRDAILPAFLHLPRAEVPMLTVHLHDAMSLPDAATRDHGVAPASDGNAFHLMDGPDNTWFTQDSGKICGWIDWRRSEAWWWVRDADDLSYIERSAPLRPLLAHWLARHRQYLVHAAAVGDARGGILILGHGGAGKSTTALVCLEAGMGYAADDHCLVETAPIPMVNSLFATGKVDVGQLPDFPALSAAAQTTGRPHTEKVVLYLSRLADRPLAPRMPLRALVLARITGRRATTLHPIRRAEAYRAIASSCALHFPSARAAALDCYSGLVKRLPVHTLELGTDRDQIPAAIRALLADPAD